MEKLKIAVLISGDGSNLQAIINECEKSDFPAAIALVVSNNPNALGIQKAQLADIKTIVIDTQKHQRREDFELELTHALTKMEVQLICLAGFMRLLTDKFCRDWHNKLINIHPSILPSFKGLDAQAQAFNAGVKYSGCTVHFVRKSMDSGPIIMQSIVAITPKDNIKTIKNKILKLEHKIYPETIRLIAENRLSFDGNKVLISDTKLDLK